MKFLQIIKQVRTNFQQKFCVAEAKSPLGTLDKEHANAAYPQHSRNSLKASTCKK